MKIKLIVWAFLALSLFTIVELARSEEKPFVRVRDLTVLISIDGLEGSGRGTGVLLDQTHVLTCAHMVNSPDDEFFIYTYPMGKVIKAHADSTDAHDDLAILVLESSATLKAFPPPVFQEKVEEGDNVTVIGNALGSMKWLVTRGVISGWEKQWLVCDANIQHGNSGGPWVNDKGEIVAMTDWMIDPKEGSIISGGISAKAINRALKTYNRKDDMALIIKALLGGN
jgi:S1-C subfamily serine protease